MQDVEKYFTPLFVKIIETKGYVIENVGNLKKILRVW